jgi:hypothetical protein
MSLQDIYYVMSIVYMTILCVIAIAVAVLLFYIMKKIADLSRAVDQQIERLNRLTADPADTAANFGAAVANTAINRISKIIKKK